MQKSLIAILRMRKSKSAYGKMAESSASTEDELLPLEGAKNIGVWQYFGFPARNGPFAKPEKCKRRRV